MATAKTICTVCNFIYEEACGELAHGAPAAARFEELPEDWRCPECNANKEMFQPCSCVSLPASEQTCITHGAPEKRECPAPTSALSKDASVAELVVLHPEYSSLFEQYGIDFCCGGKISLAEACQKKGLNVEAILEELASCSNKPMPANEPDWMRTSLKELIDHILTVYHNPLKLELIRILALAEKVARVHADRHPEMVQVLGVFSQLKEQLEVHMQKEELILFPSIVAIESKKGQMLVCGGGLEHPIRVMTMEHDEAGEALGAMRRLTNDFSAPQDACTTFKLLLSSLAQFEANMHLHVHKENNILFPRTLQLLANESANSKTTALMAN